ncbi:MAG: SGNH/GDSL hydrolase family protein [Deltaproteobacteria bacterium]|nr:SGNH/GDSL hydrolase family protein [Deltaproteobacteria bacterium]
MKREAIFNILLVVVSVVVGCMLAEAAFRVVLLIKSPERFAKGDTTKDLPAIGVYNRSLWEFDRECGYRYVSGDIYLSHVDKGQVTSCAKIPTANAQGNMGRIKGNWEDADLKIAVFGDSFAAFVTLDNITWPNVLQDVLEERLGRTVNVVNFGRDGMGVAQMFDLAAIKLPQWKPDLAIISFITNDFARARFWRTVNVIDGELRVLAVPEPIEKADPNNSYETFILHPEATLEWCRSMSGKGYLDRVGQEIVDKYLRFRQPESARLANPFDLRKSFLLDKLLKGDSYYSDKYRENSRWSPHLAVDSYDEDAQTVKSVKFLEALGIPYLLVHLPIYPEAVADKEYIMDKKEEGLLESLERLTGKKVYGLLDFVKRPVEKPERMNVNPDNYHPSLWGMQFYATAVAELLISKGYVTGGPRTR